jgi:hypothetical protein
MQLCIRIYYFTVHWRLNMFRAAYRSSSGALTVFAACGLHTQWVRTQIDYGRSPHAYENQRLQIQLDLLMKSGMPLETCWAFNEQWNNKFQYKVASCSLFLLSHTTMHGSMNIKFKSTSTVEPFCPFASSVNGWFLMLWNYKSHHYQWLLIKDFPMWLRKQYINL